MGSLPSSLRHVPIGLAVRFLYSIVHEDRAARVLWVLGWIGFVYGLQLSLLVLALLWLVNYDYGQHPDGPSMMAIIISCTAVARDAFEIGHVRWLQQRGGHSQHFRMERHFAHGA